mmetsp:Transcript_34881/g.84277  ORF Transcript_34881/g.84277 Transcript_34881/m.84277 type:complete len:291 (+) Transcript_34881:3891-4763(+)
MHARIDHSMAQGSEFPLEILPRNWHWKLLKALRTPSDPISTWLEHFSVDRAAAPDRRRVADHIPPTHRTGMPSMTADRLVANPSAGPRYTTIQKADQNPRGSAGITMGTSMPAENGTAMAPSWPTTAMSTRESGRTTNATAMDKQSTIPGMFTLGAGRNASAMVMGRCTLRTAMSTRVVGTTASRTAPGRIDGGTVRWMSVDTAPTIAWGRACVGAKIESVLLDLFVEMFRTKSISAKPIVLQKALAFRCHELAFSLEYFFVHCTLASADYSDYYQTPRERQTLNIIYVK